jgi:hypothetical protein
MLKNLQSNIKFFRRYCSSVGPNFLKNGRPASESSFDEQHLFHTQVKNMNPLKNLAIFSVKIFIFLLLANFLLVKPLSSAISKGLEGFDNNPLIKIISLDFISNPLTFIRMSHYYISKEDPQKAALYLQYAETIKSRYPYPKEINAQIEDLRIQIKKLQ